MSWNIAGAKAIITEGFTVMSSCNYSIIVLQETWLVDPIEQGGYSRHHIGAEKLNKSGRASGGLATYISTALQVTTEQLAFSSTDLQAIKINFSFNRHAPLIIFNVYAHRRKHRKILLFKKLLQKVEEIRCANPTWDILVTGDFNSNLIYTPEPEEQLAAENAIWSVLPQSPSIQTKLDIRGKQLVEALEHLSMRVLNSRVEGDVPPSFTHHSAKIATTIDYTAVSLPLLAHVKKFKIIPTLHSDHLLQHIELAWNVPCFLPAINELGTVTSVNLNRMFWTQSSLPQLCKNIKTLLQSTARQDLSAGEVWASFLQLVPSLGSARRQAPNHNRRPQTMPPNILELRKDLRRKIRSTKDDLLHNLYVPK
ncbi:hypothetical protein NDU88_002031 [Pleurodeles waltl]|uniref:Endonuclease/exonuclease/phosphatase domain-containing protein n=1 Tax=Pleurodeles waltl TaxID=8319 RepID=A0AAV7UC29_PLEWA|nr:hypothetical protein NDU88_002031 [Pleurodeles waltl]